MSFLKRVWGWTKSNFDWVVIGINAVVVTGVIYYTVQSSTIATKFEFQNKELIQQNKELLGQNNNLREVLNRATDHYQLQNKSIQKQEIIIEMQNEAIRKLLERIKQLEGFLNDDFIASAV